MLNLVGTDLPSRFPVRRKTGILHVRCACWTRSRFNKTVIYNFAILMSRSNCLPWIVGLLNKFLQSRYVTHSFSHNLFQTTCNAKWLRQPRWHHHSASFHDAASLKKTIIHVSGDTNNANREQPQDVKEHPQWTHEQSKKCWLLKVKKSSKKSPPGKPQSFSRWKPFTTIIRNQSRMQRTSWKITIFYVWQSSLSWGHYVLHASKGHKQIFPTNPSPQRHWLTVCRAFEVCV